MLAVVLGLLAFVVAAVEGTKFKLDPVLLTTLSGLVVPLAVGALTKLHAPSWFKSISNFALSAIAGGLSIALTANGEVVLSTWILGILTTFVISTATYYGLWKPTGVAAAVQQATGDVGIGPDTGGPPVSSGAGSRDDVLPDQASTNVVNTTNVVSSAPATKAAAKSKATKKAKAAKKRR